MPARKPQKLKTGYKPKGTLAARAGFGAGKGGKKLPQAKRRKKRLAEKRQGMHVDKYASVDRLGGGRKEGSKYRDKQKIPGAERMLIEKAKKIAEKTGQPFEEVYKKLGENREHNQKIMEKINQLKQRKRKDHWLISDIDRQIEELKRQFRETS